MGRLAWGLCAAAEGIAVACVGLLVAGHVGFGEAVGAYLVTNLVMVVTFGAIGGLVAGNRPENPIGWLFLAHSGCFAVATLAGTIAVARQDTISLGSLRALLVVFMGVWPLGIGIALPLAVQLFPTGRPLGPGWRWLIGLTVASGLAFAAQTLLDPTALALTDRSVPPLLAPATFHAADPLWAVASLLLVAVLAASVAELMLRFRRAHGVERLQLTWLVWAVALFAALNSPRWITGNGPILFLFTLPLVPAAAAVAILRYDLYDIRVIVNRTLVYGLLTALLGLGYAGAVLVLGQLVGRDRDSLAVAGATLAVAALVQPARRRIQQAVDGGSTAAATTPPRRSRRSAPDCASRSTWMPWPPSSARWPTRPWSRGRCRSGSGHRRPARPHAPSRTRPRRRRTRRRPGRGGAGRGRRASAG